MLLQYSITPALIHMHHLFHIGPFLCNTLSNKNEGRNSSEKSEESKFATKRELQETLTPALSQWSFANWLQRALLLLSSAFLLLYVAE